MSFNPNELVLQRVRAVEEYDLETGELDGRYTEVEDPSLKVSADGTPVTDAMGAEITTFYNAQTGTFSFTNSLFSLDLAASQFGATKDIASTTDKIKVPVSETITIDADATATLKYIPVGTTGTEISYVKVINEVNEFGKTYQVSPVAGDGKFTLDTENKKITLPTGTTGRIFVNYERESTSAVKITKTTNGIPKVKSLLIHVLFHDKCNINIVYAGVISVPRAQIDPSSIELSLKSDGKHGASYKLQKNYCSEDGKLFDIIVAED